jgi:hypothetical protein
LGVHACKAHQILHDSSGYLKLLNKMLVWWAIPNRSCLDNHEIEIVWRGSLFFW